jgi:AraC-like DNA-binding protein
MTFYSKQVLQLRKKVFPNVLQAQRIIQAKQFIDTHFSGNIDLEEMASKVFLSKFHFIRLFKKYYGCTPHQHLTGVRMAHAKKQLQAGAGVADTCYAMGFDSVTSFAALFKKMNGISPSAYAQKRAIFKR